MKTRNLLGLALVVIGPAFAGRTTLGDPKATAARGVDVSEHQGTIDWGRAAASGLSFAIVRVSDGSHHLDSQFQRNWRGARANGLVRGVYQFFRPRQDAVAQADLLLSQVGSFEPGDLPPVLDVEVLDGVSSSVLASQIQRWTSHVEARTGLTPVVYTSPGFWNALGKKASTAGVPLWVAHWGVSSPRVPTGWSDWAFWQTTDHAKVPGIATGVDGDVFHGTDAQLRAFAATAGRSGTGSGSVVVPSAGSSGSGSHSILRQGARGTEVVALQTALARKGYAPGPIDGIFGVGTRAAVVAFQRANGLVPDGIVGPLTWAALTR